MNLKNREVVEKLKELMVLSARKGNLANSGVVLDGDNPIKFMESLVVTNKDATAHSERMLVEHVCKLRGSNWTPGLTMVTVVEPCLMCLSACSQAGYKEILYIIPGNKYVKTVPWATDTEKIDKKEVAKQLSSSIDLVHLSDLEDEFSSVFKMEMSSRLGVSFGDK